MFAFQIMTHTIDIEEILTKIIVWSITKHASNLDSFLDCFERFGLDNKIELSKAVLKYNYPEIYKNHPEIFSKIGQIKKWRNQLAHLNRYVEDDYMRGSTELVLHNRSTKEERFTEKKMHKIMLMAENCSSELYSIWNLIGRERGSETKHVQTGNAEKYVP